MACETACRSILITVCLLFVCTALGSPQSGKHEQQDPRGVTVVPAAPTATTSERRVALVIGNAAYQHTTPLANPVNDAQDMARVLTDLQFQVILKTNATLDTMADAIFTFGERLKGGGVGLFYYSGHGLQVKGENYLIPVDANVVREDDIRRKAISAREILEKMDEAKSHLNLVFLDACRNNPFPRSVRAVSRGLASMSAPIGTLLVFATNPDNVAQDGTDRNGTYTKHLLRYITQPDLEVGMLLRRVRTAVREETGGQQVPWENGSIEGEFYFNGLSSVSPVTPPMASLPPQAAQERPRSEENCTQAIEDYKRTLSRNPNHFNSYYNLGNCYRKLGNTEEALRAFEKALELSPDKAYKAKTHYNVANLYQKKGDANKAKVHYEQVIELESQESDLSKGAKKNVKVLGK
jgi:tetratricopeptide (TPR) repeat protein